MVSPECQDPIDVQRDELIAKIEKQVQQRRSVLPVFSVRRRIC